MRRESRGTGILDSPQLLGPGLQLEFESGVGSVRMSIKKTQCGILHDERSCRSECTTSSPRRVSARLPLCAYRNGGMTRLPRVAAPPPSQRQSTAAPSSAPQPTLDNSQAHAHNHHHSHGQGHAACQQDHSHNGRSRDPPSSPLPLGHSPLGDTSTLIPFYITFALVAILIFNYPFARLILDDRHGSDRGSLLSWVAYLVLSCLTLTSLIRVHSADPGIVSDPRWSESASPSELACWERKANGSRRVCRKTRMWKPDRAHFCRSTGRLIKRYDHHCIFVGASVGWGNHKFFVLFLLYAWLEAAFICYQLVWTANVFEDMPSVLLFLSLFAEFVLTAAVSISVAGFWVFHLYLLAVGTTTLESGEKNGQVVLGTIYSSPYSTTWYHNFAQVLGDGESPLWWLLPTAPRFAGDGTAFPVSRAHPQRAAQTAWEGPHFAAAREAVEEEEGQRVHSNAGARSVHDRDRVVGLEDEDSEEDGEGAKAGAEAEVPRRRGLTEASHKASVVARKG